MALVLFIIQREKGLLRKKAHWNFIQSSTCMTIERAFGLLKERWPILLIFFHMPLWNLLDIGIK